MAVFDTILNFIDRGGSVLIVIMGSAFIMWAFILERFFYFKFAHKAVAAQAIDAWAARKDKSSTYAKWVKDMLVSRVRQKCEENVLLVKALVAIAPLFGLLGTVTGMVQVFDILALTGSADARAMSAGVSRATIPTMAGMVVALSGIIATISFDSSVNRRIQAVDDALETESTGKGVA
jgi:biopolymer transport protein ExbB